MIYLNFPRINYTSFRDERDITPPLISFFLSFCLPFCHSFFLSFSSVHSFIPGKTKHFYFHRLIVPLEIISHVFF